MGCDFVEAAFFIGGVIAGGILAGIAIAVLASGNYHKGYFDGFQAAKDENAVLVSRGQRAEFEQLIEAVDEAIAAR